MNLATEQPHQTGDHTMIDVASGNTERFNQTLCLYEDWINQKVAGGYTRHPDGYLIFLTPAQTAGLDEYANGDPFGFDVDSAFQHARISKTLSLISCGLEANMSEDTCILDVGCGQGHITKRIAESFPGVNVFGVDTSINAIKHAQAHLSSGNLSYLVADAYLLPFRRDTIDIIVMNNIWEHVFNPVMLAREARRVLRPGGLLIVSTPSRYRLSMLLKVIRGKQISISPHHITEYTVGQMFELLSFAGFENVVPYRAYYMEKVKIWAIRKRLFFAVRKILDFSLRMMHSHHILSNTAFYTANKPK